MYKGMSINNKNISWVGGTTFPYSKVTSWFNLFNHYFLKFSFPNSSAWCMRVGQLVRWCDLEPIDAAGRPIKAIGLDDVTWAHNNVKRAKRLWGILGNFSEKNMQKKRNQRGLNEKKWTIYRISIYQ